MKKLSLFMITALLFSSIFSGCKKDDPEPENENELITTVKVTFTEGDDDPITFIWKDLTPGTGDAPIINAGELKSGTTYTVNVEFLDESKTPAEDITEEVAEEADEHIIFLYPGNGTWAATDKDENNLPIGLSGTYTSGEKGNSTLRVVLKHQPGVKDGTFAPGSADADVTFPLVIE